MTGGADQVRLLMREAFKHSRRELIAAFWLLNDSYYRKDFKAALYYSDVLLRTRPELGGYIFSYLSLIAEAPDGRGLLIEKLASGPKWRSRFLDMLPRASKNADTPLFDHDGIEGLGKARTG